LTKNQQVKKDLIMSVLIFLVIIIIDQVVKYQVKTSMMLNTQIKVAGEWFFIHFTENPGMAFGLTPGGEGGKIWLSSFRIIAVLGIGYYLWLQIKNRAAKGFIICLSMIMAGAFGNIIDSIFYGKIFTDSYYRVAEFMPQQGYAGWLEGKVVDMFYFPIIRTHYPSWFPVWAGEEFIFFRPIFNVADSFISIGVMVILIFQNRFFPKDDKQQHVPSDETVPLADSDTQPSVAEEKE
jgi:signal peptidase II